MTRSRFPKSGSGPAEGDPRSPQEDPRLQSPDMLEMLWALELAASRGLDRGEAAAVWQSVKRRMADALPPRLGPLHGLEGTLSQAWRVVVASLVQEALSPSPAVRGSDAETTSGLLVYETQDHVISLSLNPRAGTDRLRLVGQVAPKTAQEIPPGGKVVLWSGSESFVADVGDLGEFAIDNVPAGELHMDILLQGDCLQLSPISASRLRREED